METQHEATAPATPSGQTVSAELLLAPFVGRGDGRSWLDQPLSIRGDLVACNGHIFVCVTGAGLGVATNPAMSVTMFDLHAEGTDRAWDDALVAIESVQPVLADGQAVECDTCEGRGRVIEKCDECEGGTFVHGSHKYTCMECGGEGCSISAGDDHECPTCHGSGVNRDLSSTIVDGTRSVSYHYIKQMQSLPECFIEAKAQEKHNNQKCFYFRFRGGWGLVMSYRT